MSITERQHKILSLLEKRVFCTVQQLSEATFSSPASIRRDLSLLQTRGYITRTHGGASLSVPGNRAPSLRDRMEKNVSGKRRIAKKASELLCDGQSVLLDSSSTASFLLPYLAEHERIELFTNSMDTAMHAIDLGIPTYCLGGRAIKNSAVLASEVTYQTVQELRVDILFFSSQCLDKDGVISDSGAEENHLRRLMLQAARQRVFLCDQGKFGQRALFSLTNLNDVDVAVFDQSFPELKTKCRILED